ncbi:MULTISPECIES: (d)CMP kinase [Desulfurella]|jgi:cytidylate kinase|uniref:Cytidylate kinase n=2 Tax=Desulfurella TaxID=33001 RepID=A0A1G6KYJ3_9BACT|nr:MULTISPECIES: (d)CMP kinase [Desulfurella]PMP69339.1 MAG: (d)CMP kinase [Desulfurella multipotens]PMP92792.1 MAG: (d)CMP kinase [Desulfurella sp.]SDC35555.1 cytidylate kinase [Desulfurella multipotens]HEX13397.1 (d)CMP kinase [Desulfurella acetivorans]
MSSFIITIDGPSGAGKSTICKMFSINDGFVHIDTGKIYRSIAYILKEVTEEELNKLELDFKIENLQVLFIYKGKILNDIILSEDIAKKASTIAKNEFVRDFVNKLARTIAQEGKFVIDGRDAGSVIFPNANIKFYLDAKLEERAKRRSKELSVDYSQSIKSLSCRDEQDTQRKIAPLVVPKGAIIIDTTFLSVEEVYNKIKSYF